MMLWQKDLVDWYGYENLAKFNAGKGEEFSADNEFQKGQVAMIIDGEWRVAFLQDQAPDVDFGTAPFPVPDDQADRYGAGYVTGNIMGVSKSVEEPGGGLGADQVPHPDTGAIVKLANGIKNVPTTQAALRRPDLQVDDAFKTFLDMFDNPASQTSPSTADGAVYQNQFDDFFQQWEPGKVDRPGCRLAEDR